MPFTIKTLAAVSLAAVVTVTGYVPVANAFNFGDMMNPSRWMGGGRNRDRYDDYYDDYGPYGGGPWGGGPWGGGPWGGGPYGGPGYGFPGAYGAPYAAPPVAPVAPVAPAAAPAPAQSSGGSEIDALKRRIEELESRQQPSQSAPANDWPSAPAFRPMNQY